MKNDQKEYWVHQSTTGKMNAEANDDDDDVMNFIAAVIQPFSRIRNASKSREGNLSYVLMTPMPTQPPTMTM